MKRAMQQTTMGKRKSPKKHPRQSLDPRQAFLVFGLALESADTLCLQKAKGESKEVNGAEEGEEGKPKKATASSKKAPAAEKKVTEKKAPAKKRAPKKVPPFSFELKVHASYTLQDVEESGEDFADEIDDVPADEDEPSEPETKKRKVCPASQTWLKPAFLSPTGE